jgi:hypothetical protein
MSLIAHGHGDRLIVPHLKHCIGGPLRLAAATAARASWPGDAPGCERSSLRLQRRAPDGLLGLGSKVMRRRRGSSGLLVQIRIDLVFVVVDRREVGESPEALAW